VAGIPAPTLSSSNLHTDYHRPQDEARLVDSEHLAAVIGAATREGVPSPLRSGGYGIKGATTQRGLVKSFTSEGKGLPEE
jgi:hypothetical protein